MLIIPDHLTSGIAEARTRIYNYYTANSANIRATATKVMKVHRGSLGKLEQQTGVMCTLSVYVSICIHYFRLIFG